MTILVWFNKIEKQLEQDYNLYGYILVNHMVHRSYQTVYRSYLILYKIEGLLLL